MAEAETGRGSCRTRDCSPSTRQRMSRGLKLQRPSTARSIPSWTGLGPRALSNAGEVRISANGLLSLRFWCGLPDCKPVSVPLRAAVIRLGRPLLNGSSDLPGSRAGRAAPPPLFGLAPRGVYPAGRITPAAVRSYRTISPLPCCQGGIFSVALSVSANGPRPLAGTLPCGDRTFLPRAPNGARERLPIRQPYLDHSPISLGPAAWITVYGWQWPARLSDSGSTPGGRRWWPRPGSLAKSKSSCGAGSSCCRPMGLSRGSFTMKLRR